MHKVSQKLSHRPSFSNCSFQKHALPLPCARCLRVQAFLKWPLFSKRSQTDKVAIRKREQLLQGILDGGIQRSKVDRLIDELASCRAPIKKEQLGGGPWVVIYTRGSLQLWKASQLFADALVSGAQLKNLASQEFNPRLETVINKAEFFGGDVFVTASGSFKSLDELKQTPVRVRASIKEGCLQAWKWSIPLPIAGEGEFEILYIDDCLRIFRSNGSFAVQVKESILMKEP